MKIIEATWEKRNLGVSCLEMEADKRDSVTEILSVLQGREEQYQVVKVASGRADISFALQDIGFRYIETLFETGVVLKDKPVIPDVCRNLIKYTDYHTATDEEEKELIRLIKTGSIFTTDRIALDPSFSIELAGQRYAFWLEDLLCSGKETVFIAEYKHKCIGFNTYVERENYYDGVLGGLYPEYIGSGLGFVNAWCGMNACYEHGARKIKSHVSSNNFTMLQLHLMLGMKIEKIVNTFVKHL